MEKKPITVASEEKKKKDNDKKMSEASIYNSVKQIEMEAEHLNPQSAGPKEVSASIEKEELEKAVTIKAATPPAAPKIRGGKYANEFHMGKTKSGKDIMSHAGHASHKRFSIQDHTDAYFAHANRLNEMHPSVKTPEIEHHHNDMMRQHWDARNALADNPMMRPDQSKSLAKSLKKAMIPDVLQKTVNFKEVEESIKGPEDVSVCMKNRNPHVRAMAIRSQHATRDHIEQGLKDESKAVRFEAEKKASKMEKADSYPKELASKNIEAHTQRLKANPSKYPGGRKQAVAIGISQAKEHQKEPKLSKTDEGRCWEGYEPTPGKKAFSKGSCQKIKKALTKKPC